MCDMTRRLSCVALYLYSYLNSVADLQAASRRVHYAIVHCSNKGGPKLYIITFISANMLNQRARFVNNNEFRMAYNPYHSIYQFILFLNK